MDLSDLNVKHTPHKARTMLLITVFLKKGVGLYNQLHRASTEGEIQKIFTFIAHMFI